MNNRITGLALSATIALSSCSPAEAPKSPPQQATGQDTLEQTQECIEDYFSAPTPNRYQTIADTRFHKAIKFASSLHDAEASEVVDFMTSSVSYTQVRDDKTELLILEKGETYNGCGFLSFMASVSAFGHYNNETDAVYLIEDNDNPISDLWGAIIILHEMRHALSRTSGRESQTEERNTRIFEQRMIQKVGGNPYTAYLQELKHNISKEGFGRGNDYTLVVDTELIDDKALDQIFGKSTSIQDAHLRGSMVYTHALFEIIAESTTTKEEAATIQQYIMDQLRPIP